MKQILISVCSITIISFTMLSCKKIELQNSDTATNNKLESKISSTTTTSTAQLFVAKLRGIGEGWCIATRTSPRSFSGLPYCVKWATSDFVEITVHDANTNLPVSGVDVTGTWSGAYQINSISSVSDKKGIAIINGLSGYTSAVTFTVVKVSARNSFYDQNLNVATSVTIR